MPSAAFTSITIELNQVAAPSSTAEHRWTDTAPTSPTALLTTPHAVTPFALPGHDAYAALARKVGNPGIDRLRLTTGIEFFVGATHPSDGPINPIATSVLNSYLTAVAEGTYPARDSERLRARQILASPEPIQVRGDCVITGLADHRPSALPDPFLGWLANWTPCRIDATAARIAADVAADIADRANADLAARGVPLRCTVVTTEAEPPMWRAAS